MGFTRPYPFPYHNESNPPWDDEGFLYLKKLLKFILKSQNDPHPPKCSYCRRYFGVDRDNISIDIEHILPKEKYKEYTFFIENLTLACKRCNMSIKGKRLDFLYLKRGDAKYNNFLDFDLNNYKFLHPNMENISDYIKYFNLETDDGCILFYQLTSLASSNPRAAFTYEFFRLNELQVDSRENYQNNDKNSEVQDKYKIPNQL